MLLKDPMIDVNKSDTVSGETPLFAAARKGHTENARILTADPRVDVNWAATRGHVEVVRILLADPRVDVNCANFDDNSALMEASKKHHVRIVKILLEKPKLNLHPVNADGKT
eukprot:762392_1